MRSVTTVRNRGHMETAKSTQSDQLKAVIQEGKIYTSSELIRSLQRKGFKPENARQIISRHSNKDGVWRSEKLRLPHDERLFSDSGLVGTTPFFTQVGEKLRTSDRHGLARCVAALSTHGVLHRNDLLRLLAVTPECELSPTGQRRGPIYEAEVQSLQELGARLIQAGTAMESLVAPGVVESAEEMDALANGAAEQVRYEALLARILVERLRRQNMLSWNRVDLPDTTKPYTVFNGQIFSAYGFSYLSPLVRWKEGKQNPTPCPVLIDCYHGICSLSQVESFIQRIERATFRRKKRMPVLGVIAARDFHSDAWGKARLTGLMTVSFRQMFGDEALDAMVEVERLLGGFGRVSLKTSQERFSEVAELMDDLKTNPVITDLRAIGLEALCALILQSQGYESLELGRNVRWKNTTRDVDVFAVRGDADLRIVECKAYHRHKSILGPDVRKFFTETVPALKKWMRGTDRPFETCTAEIWTTGPKGKEAEEALKKLSSPRRDTWELRRMRDMHDDIPKSIRKRSVKLLEAISITKTKEIDVP